jgi:shikimate 5-dehydrogenase
VSASHPSASPPVLTLEQVTSWDGPSLILFVGISTGSSVAHAVFGGWASVLGQPWRLAGVDLRPGTSAGTYQRLVAAMHRNPCVRGAVVTAHKLRLYRACAADLDRCDRLAGLTREINTLASRDSLAGYARDALSLTCILPGLAARSPVGTLAGLHVLCLGAGGAATALLLALHLDISVCPDTATTISPRADCPAHVTFADSSAEALDALRRVAARARIDPARLSFAHVRGVGDCDRLVAELPVPALVINATGLGKDQPGSPLTPAAHLGPGTLAWDLNYRGSLTFLHQAAARGAAVLDGWEYFIAGWAGALTAIAGISFTARLLTQLAEVAAPYRPQPENNLARGASCPGR